MKKRCKYSLIVAMANNNVIGKDNNMPWGRLQVDLNYFKEKTLNKTVIMGRKTYESIGKPLPNRTNIVISSKHKLKIPGVTVVSSLEEAVEVSYEEESEVFFIGGETIYKKAINFVDNFYITNIDLDIKGDTFFPSIENLNLKLEYSKKVPADDKNKYNVEFVKYIKI